MTDHGTTVSAVLYFDETGRLVDFVADRHYAGGDETTIETWTTPIREYGEMEGLRIPVKGEGAWELESRSLIISNYNSPIWNMAHRKCANGLFGIY